MLRVSVVLRKSFNIGNNVKSLFTSPVRNGFKSLEGARALNMIALLLCHMAMAKMFLPYTNKTEMSEVRTEKKKIRKKLAVFYYTWVVLKKKKNYSKSYFVEHVENMVDHRKSGLLVHGFFSGDQRFLSRVHVESIYSREECYFTLHTVSGAYLYHFFIFFFI